MSKYLVFHMVDTAVGRCAVMGDTLAGPSRVSLNRDAGA